MKVKASVLVSAITGRFFGDFREFHAFADKLLGRPIWTHEFGDPDIAKEIHEKAMEFIDPVNNALQNLEIDIGEPADKA